MTQINADRGARRRCFRLFPNICPSANCVICGQIPPARIKLCASPSDARLLSIKMLTPLSPAQWDADKAAHLLNRAGFGGTPAHIDSLARSGMAASVRYLIDGPATPVARPGPGLGAADRLPRPARTKVQAGRHGRPPPPSDEAGMNRRPPPGASRAQRKQEFEPPARPGLVVARPDAPVRRSAGGKDDAFLARPLRHQRAEGQGRRT